LTNEARARQLDEDSLVQIQRLLTQRGDWQRLQERAERAGEEKAEAEAQESLGRIDSQLRITVAEAEYISVERRFKLALLALAIAGIMVFAAGAVAVIAKGYDVSSIAAKDSVPVIVTLTRQGADRISKELIPGCSIVPGEPENATLVGGTPGEDARVVFGRPDACAAHAVEVSGGDGTVVPVPPDRPAVSAGTLVKLE
jgi:hypothetical protein